jgi:hypothetical protein
MPEIPNDPDAFVLDALDDADGRLVQVPVGTLRGLHRDAHSWRRAHGGEGGQAPAGNPVPGSVNAEGETVLEPGEERLTNIRRELTQQAPPDRPQLGNVYKEGAEIMERVEDDGGKHVEAWAAASGHVVQSVIRGNPQAVLRESPGRGVGG